MLYPIIWSLYVSICSIVPIGYYRVKLIKAYSRSTASTNFTEPWKLCSSLGTLWVVSCVCAAFCFINVNNAELEVCVLTLAFSKNYLVPFFIFVTSVTVMVATEYLRLIIFVIYGIRWLSPGGGTSDKWHKFVQFDPRMSRIILVMAGTFIACWIPFLTSVFYYLHPNDPPNSSRAHTITHWVHILPLLHSTINPFIYSLSEREFRECIGDTIRGLKKMRLRETWPLRPKMAEPRRVKETVEKESPGHLRSRRKWGLVPGKHRERCYTVSSSLPMTRIDGGTRNDSEEDAVRGRFYLRSNSLQRQMFEGYTNQAFAEESSSYV